MIKKRKRWKGNENLYIITTIIKESKERMKRGISEYSSHIVIHSIFENDKHFTTSSYHLHIYSSHPNSYLNW
jgi:hypothetical protein